MIKLIKRLIIKIRVAIDYHKYKKLCKRLGAVRYMDTSSLYPTVLSKKEFIYTDTDSFLVKDAIERRIKNEKIL